MRFHLQIGILRAWETPWYHIQHGGNGNSSYYFISFPRNGRLLKYVLQGIKRKVFLICPACREDCGTSAHLDKDIFPKCQKGDMHFKEFTNMVLLNFVCHCTLLAFKDD